jgi:very-short-patch-repair endonuclease
MDDLKAQLKKYREKLLNFTGRNRELYYYPNKGKALNLTELHSIANPDATEKRGEEQLRKIPEVIRMNSNSLRSFFEGDSLDLNEYLLFKSALPEPIEKRLKKLRSEDIAFQKEYGLSGTWLLGPFLVWHQKDRFNQFKPAITPLLKCPIDIENKKNDWKLILESSEYEWNPTLVVALKNYWNVELPDANTFETVEELVRAFIRALANRSLTVRHDESKSLTLPNRVKLFEKIVDEETGEITKRELRPENSLSADEISFYASITKDSFILMDVFYVDLINASSLPLYADYEKMMEGFENHPILSVLLGSGAQVSDGDKVNITVSELDSAYKEYSNKFVVDVDGSQHKAVVAAAQSDSIVLVGPPGTGKSQTITNLIASNLSEGKKVLFVAEKRAALDVVHDRLSQVGVDAPCVLVHGASVSYSDVYKSVVENTKLDFPSPGNWKQASDRLDRIKGKINEYRLALEAIHTPSELDSAGIFAELGRFHDVPHSEELGNRLQGLKYTTILELGAEVDRLRLHIQKVPEYSKNLLRYLKTPLTQQDVSHIERNIEQLKKLHPTVASLEDQLTELTNNRCGKVNAREIPLSGLQSCLDHVKRANLGVLSSALSLKERFPSVRLFLSKLDSLVETLRKQKANLDLTSENATSEMAQTLFRYFGAEAHFFSILTGKYWQQRKMLQFFLGNSFRDKKASRLEIVEGFLKYNSAYEELKNLLALVGCVQPITLRDLPGIEHLVSDIRNTAMCYDFAAFTSESLQWHTHPKSEVEIRELADFVSKLLSIREQSGRILPEWTQKLASISPLFEAGSQAGQIHNMQHSEALAVVLAIGECLKDWEAIERIHLKIKEIEKDFALTGLEKVIGDHLAHHLIDWSSVMRASVARIWHRQVLNTHRVLKGFERTEFESWVKEFQELTDGQTEMAPQEVNAHALGQLGSLFTLKPDSAKSLKAIEKEAEKQRRVKPLRQLFEDGHKNMLFAAKPCWLMNPLAISQFLPNIPELFDVVIFDEASQVRVEAALPCLYRAKKAIVVGDPNQMPPTNFFELSSVEDEEDDDEESFIELENSILDLAQLKFPRELLTWHYRSRDEALITFSNRAFYAGKLIAVPNPKVIAQEPRAYSFVQVPGFYNSKTGNVVEAQAVAGFVQQHLLSGDTRSIGVIAFGEVQRRAVEEALSKLREGNSQFDGAYTRAFEKNEEGLFVKNLENVQGDERDVIVLSIGYAPPAAGKKLRLHFGPLTIQGGERRLNVAITRAKKQMAIFCSFDPTLIPSSNEDLSNNRRNALIGKFLQYARSVAQGDQEQAITILDSLGTPGLGNARKGINRFEADVKRELEKEGHQVDAQIGTCGFFIDLAVRHPSIPGNYIIGIECDGAQFHSTPYARERDKIREALLRSRGWKIHRVWSQDWSQSRSAEIARMLVAVKAAIAEEKSKTATVLQFKKGG